MITQLNCTIERRDSIVVLTIELPEYMFTDEDPVAKRRRELQAELDSLAPSSPISTDGAAARLRKIELDAKRQRRVDDADAEAERKRLEAEAAHAAKVAANPGKFMDGGKTLLEDD